MQQILKHKIVHLFLLVSLLAGLNSCSEYQKALKSDEAKQKYEVAMQLYEEGLAENKKSKHKKALRLIEQVLPQYRGKPQGEHISFVHANSYYILGAYFDSAYQFERFTKSYPNSQKYEEAFYKSALSYYNESPRYSLDQTETLKAMNKFQEYISKFPDGEHIGDANEKYAALREKLEKKAYEIAKSYHHREDYKAAMEAFDNFIENNPGSKFRDEAYFYKLDAAYVLAINSYAQLVEERLIAAQTYYEDYLKYFPQGKYVEQANTIAKEIKERLNNNSENNLG
jgi:outer membrane protein assembly factor BamD